MYGYQVWLHKLDYLTGKMSVYKYAWGLWDVASDCRHSSLDLQALFLCERCNKENNVLLKWCAAQVLCTATSKPC